jgi:hypothetical protein
MTIRNSLLRIGVGIWLASACSGARPVPDSSAAPSAKYHLRGIVRDSATGRPVPGVWVWPIYRSWGVTTDSEGQFNLEWPYSSFHTFLIRKCSDENLASVGVEFRDTTVIERQIQVIAPLGQCAADVRPPWAVDARDTTQFRGFYVYSWEGGGFLLSCVGEMFQMDWDSPLGPLVRGRRGEEGQHTFVRARGRIAVATRTGYSTGGELFLVGKVEEVRDPRSEDCQ